MAAVKKGIPVNQAETIAALHRAKEKFRKAFLKKVGPVDVSKHAKVLEEWKTLPCRKLMEDLRTKLFAYQQKHFPEVISHPSVLFKKDLTSPKAELDFLFPLGDLRPSPEVFTMKPPSSTADLPPDLREKISSPIYCDSAMLYRISQLQVLHRAESPSCIEATNVIRTVGTSLGHQTLLNECNICHKVFHVPATPAVTITFADGTTKQSSPPLLTALTSALVSGNTKASVMRVTADLGIGTATSKVIYQPYAFYITP